MKKIAIIAGAATLLLSVATPAFAFPWFSSDDISVSNFNSAVVTTVSEANSNSGQNSQNQNVIWGVVNNSDGNRNMTTGVASSTSDAQSLVNKNQTNVNSVMSRGDIRVSNRNSAFVLTDSFASANSGLNDQNQNVSFGGSVINTDGNRNMTTGNAVSKSCAESWANLNYTRVSRFR